MIFRALYFTTEMAATGEKGVPFTRVEMVFGTDYWRDNRKGGNFQSAAPNCSFYLTLSMRKFLSRSRLDILS